MGHRGTGDLDRCACDFGVLEVRVSEVTGLALLRVPFAEHHISYLPKGGIKIAYVGHAALTDRLLDVDPHWTWEPLAMSPDGLPVFDGFGGMWIKLTVLGVARLGYGHAGNKEGGDAIKEVIGDALRNSAMRFGAALDLWHKGDLHKDEKDEEPAINRTLVMKCRTNIQEHIAHDRPMGVREEWEAAQEHGKEFATAVWAGLTTPERDFVRQANNNK
jgi:hypothetical protein